MPAYQATFRHPVEREKSAARRIRAASIVNATLIAAGMEHSIAVAEQWPEPAELIALSLLPEEAPAANPRPTPPAAIERAKARAAEFARDAAHARQIFEAACVVAGVRA
jgi:hypothetical protein